MKNTSCIGCGAMVPDMDGPVHKYLGVSPGCWYVYGQVLAREYSDPDYMKMHRLTVDAYSLQHLGAPSPQTIQSMNVHLIALCAALEHDVAYDFIPKVLNDRLKKYKEEKSFTWLIPPASLGDITVVDVVKATTVEEHSVLVDQWARDVWGKWRMHHDIIESFYKGTL